MSDYRFEFVQRNGLDCLHVMIDSNSLKEIADTHIPLDDILDAAVAVGMLGRGTIQPQAPNSSVDEPIGAPAVVEQSHTI